MYDVREAAESGQPRLSEHATDLVPAASCMAASPPPFIVYGHLSCTVIMHGSITPPPARDGLATGDCLAQH